MYIRPVCLLAAAVVALSGCGSTADTARPPTPLPRAGRPSPPRRGHPPAPPPGLSITDPWVKTAKKGMTAAFGTLVNNTDAEVTIVAGTSPLSPKIELHEVVDSERQDDHAAQGGRLRHPRRAAPTSCSPAVTTSC